MPRILIANIKVSVANDLRSDGVESGNLVWTASQVALVEVAPGGLCKLSR